MATELSGPPVLSTPDSHILSEIDPVLAPAANISLSDEQLAIRYEVCRTIDEIRGRRWRRVALQFPDHMLYDSVRVYRLLSQGLSSDTLSLNGNHDHASDAELVKVTENLVLKKHEAGRPPSGGTGTAHVKLTILGDTSYGSCCVDEVAAEHINADVIVHYGRSCLSPSSRLPVLHVFTKQDLDHEDVLKALTDTFADAKDAKIILTADMPFMDHIDDICAQARRCGFEDIFATAIAHDPSSLIPNRTLPEAVNQDPEQLSGWDLFHISDPPTSLLLTLSSKVKSVHVYPTNTNASSSITAANTAMVLRRRYALVTSLTTVSTWGILINTLSVKNYLHIVDHVKRLIANAGKKSYVFVVGKLNAAKVANFAEIDGWVVIGCWESSLIDSRDFYKPIITPFELELVLAGDDQRIWTGEWRADFQRVLDQSLIAEEKDHNVMDETASRMPGAFIGDGDADDAGAEVQDWNVEDESAPPDFDLRTGRYVSRSRPMVGSSYSRPEAMGSGTHRASSALTKRATGDVLAVKGVASPAAEFLATRRTWRGLGSEFEVRYDEDEEEQGGLVEEGRAGVARGYTVGGSGRS